MINKSTIISIFSIILLQILLKYISIVDSTFIDSYLHYNTVSFVLECIIPIYAATLAYFALIPKYDLEKLKSILLQLQQSDKNLLQIKKLYDDYKSEYNKIENIDKTIIHIKNLHVLLLALLTLSALAFLLVACIKFPIQILSMIIILLLSRYAEYCIEKTYVKLSTDYPSPSDLLDVSKNLTSISNIDINLYQNLPAYIFARGTSITVKNDLLDFSLIGLKDKDKYSNFILINFALPFKLENVSLRYTSKNNSLESISLSDKKLLHDRKNPSLEILITKDKELDIAPHLKLTIDRIGTLQEIWPFTPRSANSSEYIGRYPITINIHKLKEIDMSRYIIH